MFLLFVQGWRHRQWSLISEAMVLVEVANEAKSTQPTTSQAIQNLPASAALKSRSQSPETEVAEGRENRKQREFPATKLVKVMGGGDDRTSSYYGGPPGGPRCGPTSAATPRDFHYVTSGPPDHHFRSGSSSSRQSRNSSSGASSNYHSPHVASAASSGTSSRYDIRVISTKIYFFTNSETLWKISQLFSVNCFKFWIGNSSTR